MTTHSWRDWSCGVRLVLGRAVGEPVAADAVAVVRELMAEVEQAVSRFRADSEVERINDAAPRMLPVGPLTLVLVSEALEAARRTDGAVDPTVGRHLAALGYDGDIAEVRTRVASTPRPALAPRSSRSPRVTPTRPSSWSTATRRQSGASAGRGVEATRVRTSATSPS